MGSGARETEETSFPFTVEWGSWDGVSLRLLTTRVRLQAAITETHLPKTIVKQVFRKQQQRERERERGREAGENEDDKGREWH